MPYGVLYEPKETEEVRVPNGYIFTCNYGTERECFERKLFAMPISQWNLVCQVGKGDIRVLRKKEDLKVSLRNGCGEDKKGKNNFDAQKNRKKQINAAVLSTRVSGFVWKRSTRDSIDSRRMENGCPHANAF